MKRKREPPLYVKAVKRRRIECIPFPPFSTDKPRSVKKWYRKDFQGSDTVCVKKWTKDVRPSPLQNNYSKFTDHKYNSLSYTNEEYRVYVGKKQSSKKDKKKKKKSRKKKKKNANNGDTKIHLHTKRRNVRESPPLLPNFQTNSIFKFHLPPTNGNPPPPPPDDDKNKKKKNRKAFNYRYPSNISYSSSSSPHTPPTTTLPQPPTPATPLPKMKDLKKLIENKTKQDQLLKARQKNALEKVDLDDELEAKDNSVYFSRADEDDDEDDKWSEEETKELFEKCRTYHLNFIVVKDRLSFNRSLESIKRRYFYVSRKLLVGRTRTDISSIMKLRKCHEYKNGESKKKKRKRKRKTNNHVPAATKDFNNRVKDITNRVDYVRRNHPILITPYKYREELKRKSELKRFYDCGTKYDVVNIVTDLKMKRIKKRLGENQIKIDKYETREKRRKVFNIPKRINDLTELEIKKMKNKNILKKGSVMSRSSAVNSDLDYIQSKFADEDIRNNAKSIIDPVSGRRQIHYFTSETQSDIEKLKESIMEIDKIKTLLKKAQN